jgi:hypothetical protein
VLSKQCQYGVNTHSDFLWNASNNAADFSYLNIKQLLQNLCYYSFMKCLFAFLTTPLSAALLAAALLLG